MKTQITITLLFLSVTLILGCGSDLGPGKVTGTVTLDGKPFHDASISFHPEAGGVVPMGGTDANGRYKLYYADMKEGAPAGRYKVCLTTANPMANLPERTPEKYVTQETTDLIADVKKGKNTIDFALTSE